MFVDNIEHFCGFSVNLGRNYPLFSICEKSYPPRKRTFAVNFYGCEKTYPPKKGCFFGQNLAKPLLWKSFPPRKGGVIHIFVDFTVDNRFLSTVIHIFRGKVEYAYILHAFIIVFSTNFDTL